MSTARRNLILPIPAAAVVLVLAAACAQPATGGREAEPISIAIGEPVAGLVPSDTVEEYGNQVLESLWTGLVEYDANGEVEYTGVAESISSTDNTTWTVSLRDGWTFHDGSPVTAASFVDAWNYAAYGPNVQSASYYFANIAGYDQLQGPVDDAGEPAGDPPASEMSGLRVVDERTFTVTLVAPFVQFPATLGYNPFFPLPEAFFADPEEFAAQPIGNGPFQADEAFLPEEGVTLVRYDDYAGERRAAADALEYRVYTDLSTAYTDALAGNVDVVPGIPANAAGTARADFPGRYLESPASGLTFLAMPLYDERYADPRVRKAISMSIDRQAISEAIFSGSRQPADAVVPPVVPGHRDGACGYCTMDVARANALLDEAGFDRSRPIDLWFNAGSGNEAWVEALGNQLRTNLGVDFLLRGDLLPAEYGPLMDERGMTGPFRMGWVMDYPSPKSYLEPLFASSAQPPAGANVSFYSNPEFDALVAQGDAAPSTEAAITFYNRAEDVLLEDMPVIPLFFQVAQTVHSAEVTDVVVDVFGRVDTLSISAAD